MSDLMNRSFCLFLHLRRPFRSTFNFCFIFTTLFVCIYFIFLKS